jgi:hypothetical protein
MGYGRMRDLKPKPYATLTTFKRVLKGGITMVFPDGHVKNAPLENIWSLYRHLDWTFPARPSCN